MMKRFRSNNSDNNGSVATRPFNPNFEEIEKEMNGETPFNELVRKEKETVMNTLPELPDYVQHNPEVSDLGRITAEAVIRDYEEMAKTVEELGVMLKKLEDHQARMMSDVKAAIDDVMVTATECRKEAARMFAEIEHCSMMAASVRSTCNDVRKKIVPVALVQAPA